jgi:hypothetical protein
MSENTNSHILVHRFDYYEPATLTEAIETKDQHTAWMKVDPFTDPLRDDPRFQEVMKRAGFPE